MADSAKNRILHRTTEEGHTDSYGMLLYLAAVMGSDPVALGPYSSLELDEWSGHLDGLRAALLCLAMYERQIEPAGAAVVVNRHIADAIVELEHGDDSGSAG